MSWLNSRNGFNVSKRLKHLRLLNFVDKPFALASVIFSATNIAKLVFAPASHVVAALVLLDPEFAVRTLLVLGPFHQKHELLVVLAQVSHFFVLLAREASMELALADQAVVFFAGGTFIVS